MLLNLKILLTCTRVHAGLKTWKSERQSSWNNVKIIEFGRLGITCTRVHADVYTSEATKFCDFDIIPGRLTCSFSRFESDVDVYTSWISVHVVDKWIRDQEQHWSAPRSHHCNDSKFMCDFAAVQGPFAPLLPQEIGCEMCTVSELFLGNLNLSCARYI